MACCAELLRDQGNTVRDNDGTRREETNPSRTSEADPVLSEMSFLHEVLLLRELLAVNLRKEKGQMLLKE